MTNELRQHIRRERDRRLREHVFEGVCRWCLDEIPEGMSPLARYCKKAHSRRAWADVNRDIEYARRKRWRVKHAPAIRERRVRRAA